MTTLDLAALDAGEFCVKWRKHFTGAFGNKITDTKMWFVESAVFEIFGFRMGAVYQPKQRNISKRYDVAKRLYDACSVFLSTYNYVVNLSDDGVDSEGMANRFAEKVNSFSKCGKSYHPSKALSNRKTGDACISLKLMSDEQLAKSRV